MAGKRLRESLAAWLLGVQARDISSLQEMAREIAAIKLEWAEMLDLIQSWAGRQAKRDANAAKKSLQQSAEPTEAPSANGTLDKSELRRRAATMRFQQQRGVHP